MMILKLSDNNEILDFWTGNGTPLFEGVRYDEATIDVSDFVQNWKLYSYSAELGLYKDEAKVLAQRQKEIVQAEKMKLCEELNQIQQWMNNTDYMVLKVIRGNWSADDARYTEYLAEYEIKKSRKDELCALLGVDNSPPSLLI